MCVFKGKKKKKMDCFDSLVCPNEHAFSVESRIAKLRDLLQGDEWTHRALKVAFHLAGSLVSLCGALAERPAECFEDRLLEQAARAA